VPMPAGGLNSTKNGMNPIWKITIITNSGIVHKSDRRSGRSSPDRRWRVPMKSAILAAFAALSLAAASGYSAQAATFGAPQTTLHGAPSDNVDFGPGGSDVDGGWG
jgi:hypothetical protein